MKQLNISFLIVILLFSIGASAQKIKTNYIAIGIIQPRLNLQSKQCIHSSGLGGGSSNCFEDSSNKIGFTIGLLREKKLSEKWLLHSKFSLDYIRFDINKTSSSVSYFNQLMTSSLGSLESRTINLSISIRCAYTFKATRISLGGYLQNPLHQRGIHQRIRTTHRIEVSQGPSLELIELNPVLQDDITQRTKSKTTAGLVLSFFNHININWGIGLQFNYALNEHFLPAPLHSIELQLCYKI